MRCVRACEAVRARDGSAVAGGGLVQNPGRPAGRRPGVPFPVVGLAVPSRRFLSLLSGLNVFRMSLEVFV